MIKLNAGSVIIGYDDGYQLGKSVNFIFDNGVHQVTKIMGAILARISAVGNGNGVIGTGGAASMGEIAKEQELPSATEEFPEELDSILDMFG